MCKCIRGGNLGIYIFGLLEMVSKQKDCKLEDSKGSKSYDNKYCILWR